jgi:hypothetical protein
VLKIRTSIAMKFAIGRNSLTTHTLMLSFSCKFYQRWTKLRDTGGTTQPRQKKRKNEGRWALDERRTLGWRGETAGELRTTRASRFGGLSLEEGERIGQLALDAGRGVGHQPLGTLRQRRRHLGHLRVALEQKSEHQANKQDLIQSSSVRS